MEQSFATKINFDVGVIKELDVNSFKNVLVLTGTQYSLEIFEKHIKPLIKTNVHVYANIAATNLTEHSVYSVLNFASGNNIDCIISVGVESVMDCGRLTSLLLTHGGFLHDYIPGGTMGPIGITPNVIYHITVPIMPAAGYEISSYASFMQSNEKKMLISPYLIPKATYIDPMLMTGLPPDLWAVLGFDCFTTAMMAYVSIYANPTSDAYAEQALKSYIQFSKKIIAKPADIELIKHAAAASINSFLAANYSCTGPVHAIADVLAAKFGMRYGIALAMVCAEVCAFCYDASPERFDSVVKMLGGKGGSGTAVKKTIEKLIKDVGIQLPSLKGKIKDNEYEKFAHEAMNYAMKGCAKQMSVRDIEALLRRLP
ncbi:MAG: iron-containing alcohol dehydrogenase [Firmicutes bacterium]|nr:iron-containing alcohol dehydrogenase [Bacillota bacterium]